MTLRELGQTLREMYDNAPRGGQVTMIHLFGIKYKNHIKEYGVKEVVEESGIRSVYVTEVNKGMKLAQYVRVLE